MKKRYFLLFAIILMGIFLRFYRLNDFPVQLNHDEISQLYDAISVGQTGRDIYGNFLPTIFQSVNDYKSPFYTYATTLTYFILGNHEWIIRIPGAMFGVLTIIAVYLFTLRLINNQNIALISSSIIAISPSEIFFSRKSFENGAGIFFILMAFYFLLTYFEKMKFTKLLYLGVIFLAAGMYTYFSHAIIIPLLLLTFAYIFRKNLTGSKKKYIFVLSVWGLLIVPLLLIIFLNSGSRYRSQTVFITQDINLGRIMDYGNKYKAIFDFSFNRYLDQFNPVYIFGQGLDLTNQGPLGMGLLLLIQLPLIIIGIIYLSRLPDYNKQKNFILAWILLGMLPSGLTFEPHSPHRSIMVFTMLDIMSAIGLYSFFQKIHNLKIVAVLVIAFIVNFVYFLHIYFVNFPFEKSESIHYPFKQMALFAWSVHDNFNQIVFDPLYGENAPVIGTAAHYYMAYYGGFPPLKFQKEYHVGTKPREVLFDKFSIRAIYWPLDRNLKNTLFIASPWSIPEQDITDKSRIIKRFYFYDGKLAFYAIKL